MKPDQWRQQQGQGRFGQGCNKAKVVLARAAESARGIWAELDSWQHWKSESNFLSDSVFGCLIGSFFYITLLSWEFLLKLYNFFWNFCCNTDFLLCTTISINFYSQISFPFVLRSRKFWKGRSWGRIFFLRLRNPGFGAKQKLFLDQTMAQIDTNVWN